MIYILDYLKNKNAKSRIAFINKKLYIDGIRFDSMQQIEATFPIEGKIYFGDSRKHCKGENKDKRRIPM